MTTHTIADLIQAAVALLRAKRRLEARELLEQALAREPLNDAIWLWLSGTTEDPVEQGQLLRRALACNPDNQLARRGLATLEAQLAAAPPSPPPLPAAQPAVAPRPAAPVPIWEAAPESMAAAPLPAPRPAAPVPVWETAPAPASQPAAPVPIWPPAIDTAATASPVWPAAPETTASVAAPEPPVEAGWPAAPEAAGSLAAAELVGGPSEAAATLPEPPSPPASAPIGQDWPSEQLAPEEIESLQTDPQLAPEEIESLQTDPQLAAPSATDAWQTLEAVGAWQALETVAEPEPLPPEPEPPAEPQPWAPPEPLAAAELAEMAATCAGCEAQVYGNAAFCWRCHAAVHCCATCAFAAEPTCKELQQISGLTARNRCPWWRPPG